MPGSAFPSQGQKCNFMILKLGSHAHSMNRCGRIANLVVNKGGRKADKTGSRGDLRRNFLQTQKGTREPDRWVRQERSLHPSMTLDV